VSQRTARPPEIVGASNAIQDVLKTVGMVAGSKSTVLIQGESGTGKELIAKAIHLASPRRHRDMVAVNMAAISPELIESELFGSVRGSFTGSLQDREGYFLEAHGSTLFLDEIGEAPLSVQKRLLRVLESGEVTRVGEARPRKVDVRLVAATNKDLAKEVKQGSFREDLYYRLKVVPLALPPLRERPEDIEPIAKHFLARFSREMGRTVHGFDPAAMRKLRTCSWPGNARELRNVVELAVLLAPETILKATDLRLEQSDGETTAWEKLLEQPLEVATASFERRYFQRLLQRADGSKTKAAELAHCDRTTVYSYLRKHGLLGHDE
jgi:DNA-binding NtrC family response regulator